MIDLYRNADPAYQPYFERTRQLRAQQALRAIGRIAAFFGALAALPFRLYACRWRRLSAENQLLALDARMLKDIGLSRGEIPSKVADLQPLPTVTPPNFRPDGLGQ
jgi:uncharacterized protein YjiS (DUF1127 family)